MPNPIRRTPGADPAAPAPASPIAMPEQPPEPKLPLSDSVRPAAPELEENAPMEEPAPALPGRNPVGSASKEEDLLEKVNQLYESATKLQREADEIRKSIENEKRSDGSGESMSRAESDAASNALIGL